MKPIIYTIVILVVVLAIAFMFVDMRGLYHCSVCGKTYWGKQESLRDKPVCDECYEKKFVENYGKEKKMQVTMPEDTAWQPFPNGQKLELVYEDKKQVPYIDTVTSQSLGFANTIPQSLIIVMNNSQKEILRIQYTGEIYWWGRLVITDKELVDGLRDVLVGRSCPKCRKPLQNFGSKL